MKKAELLKTDHWIQSKWLVNQINKIDENIKESSFLNRDVAERAYVKLSEALIVNDADLEHFMSVHLSEKGLQRLITTLRVSKKRVHSKNLQVEISSKARLRLARLAELSGKTKIQIINDLILGVDLSDYERE
tara:strand:- start:504 stop:902 length:399 start_codon:yes stop_codon:yes gene_type:complete